MGWRWRGGLVWIDGPGCALAVDAFETLSMAAVSLPTFSLVGSMDGPRLALKKERSWHAKRRLRNQSLDLDLARNSVFALPLRRGPSPRRLVGSGLCHLSKRGISSFMIFRIPLTQSPSSNGATMPPS